VKTGLVPALADASPGSFGAFPDGTFLLGNLRIGTNGVVLGRVELPDGVVFSTVNAGGEVAALGKDRLWLLDADGKVLLNGVRVQELPDPNCKGVCLIQDIVVVIRPDDNLLYQRDGKTRHPQSDTEFGRIIRAVASPDCIATDSDGSVYVLTVERLYVFDASLRLRHAVPSQRLFGSVMVDGGKLYVSTDKGVVMLRPREDRR
jgi:sugar lactone lactonase YvrE